MAKKKKKTFPNQLPAVPAYETVYALLQLPEEAEDTLSEAIPLQAETLSPFDEGDYTASWEVIGKQNGFLLVWLAIASNEALTQTWHETLADRNQIASVRLDATALCWIQALPKRDPAVAEGQTLLIMHTSTECLIGVFTAGKPIALRGLPPTATAADIKREAMRVLTQAAMSGLLEDTPVKGVCYTTQPDESLPELDALIGSPCRIETLSEDDAETLLQQTLQQRVNAGKTFDLTPQIWRDEMRTNRNKRMLVFCAVLFGLLWAGAALTLFLLPKYYAQRAKETALRIQAHRTSYNEVVGLQERIDLIMRYQNRRFSALEMLRLVCAAKASDMTFLSVTYRQKQSLRISGLCDETASVYAFKEAVQKDGRILEVRINRLAQDAKTRKQRFDIDILFVTSEEDEA
ncbi:MAG: hypothetical protein IJV69_05970 [Kiritimatiellae bacterium]|nr:hypothetical protein [Kiritimatiellia bacterium]